MENLVETTLEKLKDSTNPGRILCDLWIQLFSVRFSPHLVQQFHRLIKIYGRYRVLFAIVNLSDTYYGRYETITANNPYALIAHLCKADVKDSYASQLENSEDTLSVYVEAYKERVNSKERIDMPQSFEEVDGE